MSVFSNTVLLEEVTESTNGKLTGDWIQFCGGFHNSYSLLNIGRMRWVELLACLVKWELYMIFEHEMSWPDDGRFCTLEFWSTQNIICFNLLIIAERSRFEDFNSSCAHCVHWMYVCLLAWEHTGPRDWTYTTFAEDSGEGSCSASTGLCKIIQYNLWLKLY